MPVRPGPRAALPARWIRWEKVAVHWTTRSTSGMLQPWGRVSGHTADTMERCGRRTIPAASVHTRIRIRPERNHAMALIV